MAKRIVGILNRRRLVRGIADAQGCITDPDGCCEGLISGSAASGSGACSGQCFTDCSECTAGMSALWTLSGTGFSSQLCRVVNPADGNYCRFVSPDLEWDLRYEYADQLWVLTNLNDGRVWFVTQAAWECQSENPMTPTDDGESSVTVAPFFSCASISYNCVDGECVGVVSGGTYATLAECQAACGGIPSCCPSLTTHTITAALSGGEGNLTLIWDAAGGFWGGSKALTCGETLYLKYNATTCQLAYSCNDSVYQAAAPIGAVVCEPFAHQFRCDMDNGLVGCVAGSCGTITATLSAP